MKGKKYWIEFKLIVKQSLIFISYTFNFNSLGNSGSNAYAMTAHVMTTTAFLAVANTQTNRPKIFRPDGGTSRLQKLWQLVAGRVSSTGWNQVTLFKTWKINLTFFKCFLKVFLENLSQRMKLKTWNISIS